METEYIQRRKTRPVRVGPVAIGGEAPISVQTMSKTHTRDVRATLAQIGLAADCGCEIIRCAVPDRPSAKALREVVKNSPIPVIADVHFRPELALLAIKAGAHGVRVNPGNMHDEQGVREVYRAAAEAGIKVRIGVNSGSIRAREGLNVAPGREGEDLAELMVQKCLAYAEMAEQEGLAAIVLSLKASDVRTTIAAYRLAARRCDYPFHVGVTAAGPAESSIVKSSICIGTLLAEGIGDTIRVSATAPPEWEVEVGLKVLEALGLRAPRGPQIISCPTCGRCDIDLQALVDEVSRGLRDCRRPLKVAVMGCVVNGPGEASEADVGVAGGKEFGYIFRSGKKVRKVAASKLAAALLAEVESAQ